MNPLDELLFSTGRVPGITPDALGEARAAVDEAIVSASGQQNSPADGSPSQWLGRRPATRRLSGLRGKTIIGVTAAAAAVAVAAAIVLPLSAANPGSRPLADSPTKSPVRVKPTAEPSQTTATSAVPTTVSPVKYSFRPATTDVTAAYVLNQAAQAAGAQPAEGWPDAPYWHTVQQSTCGGQVYTDNTWVNRSGNGVGLDTGPESKDPLCTVGGVGTAFAIGGTPGASIGQQQYTWSELYALPTNPGQLWPIVRADEQLPFSDDPALLKSGQADLFESIWNLLTSAPLPPTLRKALYEVTAEIPGVTVVGEYTDSLGRTGMALHIGIWTMVVDTGNGQVLAMLQGDTPPVTVCGDARPRDCQEVQTAGPNTTVYISEGPAASAPNVPDQNGAGASRPVDGPVSSPSSSSR